MGLSSSKTMDGEWQRKLAEVKSETGSQAEVSDTAKDGET